MGGPVSQCVKGCPNFSVYLGFGIIGFRGITPGFEVDNGFEGRGETAQEYEGCVRLKSDFQTESC